MRRWILKKYSFSVLKYYYFLSKTQTKPTYETQPSYLRTRVFKEVQNNNLALELGIGTGGMTTSLLKKSIEVVGLDISTPHLHIIKRRFPSVHAVKADAHHLPFKEEAFNTVFASYILHHMANIRLVCRESQRVLKENGWFHSLVPSATHPLLWLGGKIRKPQLVKCYLGHTEGDVERPLYPKDLVAPYSKLFSEIRLKYFSFLPTKWTQKHLFLRPINERLERIKPLCGNFLVSGRKQKNSLMSDILPIEKFLLIVPTYMEAENIAFLADRLKTTLKGYNYEIVIVDDNSPDGTGEEAEKLGLKVLRRQEKLGVSSAFIEGAQTTENGIVGLMDADLQHPPELIPLMLKEVYNGADIVVASRYVEGGKIEGWPLRRKIISKTAIALAHLPLTKTRKIKDPMSGFFLVKRRVIRDANLSKNKGFKILLEILVKGEYEKVVELPYTFRARKRGESKLGIGEIWNYVKYLCKLSS